MSMETISGLITYFSCGSKSVARNPHNLKRRNLPVSLVRPRLYLYSNTEIVIKKQGPQKNTHNAHVEVTKGPADSLFSLQLHEISKKRCRVPRTCVCDRGAPSGTTYRSPRLWVSVRRAAGPRLYPHVLRRLPPHTAAVSSIHKAYIATLFS